MTTLRYALLGSVAAAPQSGYQLVQQFGRSMGYVWTATQGTIYPELVRMEREGLIETVETGERGRKTYGVTPAGQEALRAWLRTEPTRQSKDELVLRVFLLDHLDDEEAAAYFRHLQDTYRERLTAYEAVLDRGLPDDRRGLFVRFTLEAGVAHERTMLAWATDCERRLREAS